MINEEISKRISKKLQNEKRFLIFQNKCGKDIFDFGISNYDDNFNFFMYLIGGSEVEEIMSIFKRVETDKNFRLDIGENIKTHYKNIEKFCKYNEIQRIRELQSFLFTSPLIVDFKDEDKIKLIFKLIVSDYIDERQYSWFSDRIIEEARHSFFESLTFEFVKQNFSDKVEEPEFDNFRYLYDNEKLAYNKNRILVYSLNNRNKKYYIVYDVNDDDFELLTYKKQYTEIRENEEKIRKEETRRIEKEIKEEEYRKKKLELKEKQIEEMNEPKTATYYRKGFFGNTITEKIKIW